MDKNIYINKDTSMIVQEILELAIPKYTVLDISKIIKEKTKVKKFDSIVIPRIMSNRKLLAQQHGIANNTGAA